jgi:hypothetical protein
MMNDFDIPKEMILQEPPPAFTKEDLTEIERIFDNWCKKTNFNPTNNERELFFLLCEYDHSHAPSNWQVLRYPGEEPKEPHTGKADQNEPEKCFKHAKIIGGWVQWFSEEHPKKIDKILNMWKKNPDRDELFQFGEVSDYLFKYMIDYFC